MKNLILKIATGALSVVTSLYVLGVMAAVPIYNWRYANEHGLVKWLLLGGVVSTAKSFAWPYFFFDTPSENDVPHSVALLLQAGFGLHSAVDILGDFNAANADEDIQSIVFHLEGALAAADLVDQRELNQIYPTWGDHFLDEWVPAVRMMHEAHANLDQHSAGQLARASVILSRYDQWVAEQGDDLMQAASRR